MSSILSRLIEISEEDKKPEPKEEQVLPTAQKLSSLSEEAKDLPPKGSRIAQQIGRKWLSNVLTSPKHLADFLKFSSERLSEMGESQAAEGGRLPSEEELAFTKNVVKTLGFPSEFLEEIFPQYNPQDVEKGLIELQKKTGAKPTPLEPHSEEEKQLGDLAAISGGAAPFGPAAMLWAPGIDLVSKGLEQLGVGKAGQTIAGLSLPAITSVISAVRSRRYIPQSGERTALYNRARQLGLTDEELAPILASEAQVGLFGKLAGGRGSTAEALENSNAALGRTRESIFQRGQAIGPIPQPVAQQLVQDFTAVRSRLTQTLNPSPKEQALINFIDEGINRLQSGQATTNELMGFRRSLNSMEGGQNALGQLRGPMQNALEAIDPALARDFNDYNRLFQFYSRNLENINPDIFRSMLGASEAGKIIEGIVTGQPTKAAVRAVSVPVFSELASRVITDPVLQSIHRNISRGLRESRPQVVRGAYQQLQKYVDKNFPDESEKIEWPDFD